MPDVRAFHLVTAVLAATGMMAAPVDTTIAFRQGSHADLLQAARRENRPMMLYFHFDGCSACLKMERTAFKDDSVIHFLNDRYCNVEVNSLKGEGVATSATYGVTFQPTFLFLDPQGTELHRIVGVFTPQEFLSQARMALDPAHNLARARERYRNGDRDPEFLFDLCYRMRDAHELDSALINEYLSTQALDHPDDVRNIRFIHEFVIHHFHVTMPYGSRGFDYLYRNRAAFHAEFEPDQVDVRILWVLDHALVDAIDRQDEARFDRVLMLMDSVDHKGVRYFKEMDGRITGARDDTHLQVRARLAYHERSGDRVLRDRYLKEYLEAIHDDPEALNELAWRYYEERTDAAELEQALSWSERAVALDDNYMNNDTYAALLFKTGRHASALERARHAVELASRSGEDHSATDELVLRIQAAIGK